MIVITRTSHLIIENLGKITKQNDVINTRLREIGKQNEPPKSNQINKKILNKIGK